MTIFKNEEYEGRIENQSLETINLNSGRGTIYDRNNLPLTDNKKSKILIVPKEIISGNYKNILLIKKATKLSEKDIYKAVQQQLSKQIIEIDIKYIDKSKINELKEKNILVKEKTMRYSDKNLLTHLIGYVKISDKNGVSGIEKHMNNELKDGNKNYVSVFKAGVNNQGLKYLKGSIKEVCESENSSNLKLTIDSKAQEKLEKIMDKEENPSAAIISNMQTGEILAICSRANFSQNKIYSYINSKEGELQNRALSVTYPPGSVFKLVVLYAALENKIIDENYTYYCNGSTKLGLSNEVLNCNNYEAHGMETLSDSLSNSCNCAFYDIAKRVGSKKIFQAIKELHLDQKVNIGIDEEKNSKLPEKIALSNLAIGQANIEFTPLQINQLTQLIANNGTYKPLYIYDSIIDNNKKCIKKYKFKKNLDVIAPYTMTRIKEMMTQVSKVGTAKSLKDLKNGCGVKTGTAQSSLNGKKISHGWITGFYPEINPQYAITIIVEGTEKESKSAIPIFKEVCENLK
ncbi:peptidoglycan D,D-transpeptidase FtsI family protein [Terrisporobacter sp.]